MIQLKPAFEYLMFDVNIFLPETRTPENVDHHNEALTWPHNRGQAITPENVGQHNEVMTGPHNRGHAKPRNKPCM